jgi:phospholipid transport system substrate-binding protein
VLKKLILTFSILFLTTSSFALTEVEIKTEMNNKIDKILIVLKDSKISKDKKAEEIIQIMDDVFNYPLMSKLSLGKTWKKINNNQKTEFTKVFTEKLKASYVEKLDLYTDELVEISGTKKVKKNRIVLSTQLIGKDEKHDINYKFYTKKNQNNWLIYDVDLIGVSIIKTYQAQFRGFLKKKSFNELLFYLKNKK